LEKSPLPPKGAGEQGPELPSREEVLAYCATVAQGPIPADFAATRIADYDGRAIGWPRYWRRALLSDWQNPVRRAEFTKAMAKNGAEKSIPTTSGHRVADQINERKACEKARRELQEAQDALTNGGFGDVTDADRKWKREKQAALDERWRALERREKALNSEPEGDPQ
jgi:hypothetical protein